MRRTRVRHPTVTGTAEPLRTITTTGMTMPATPDMRQRISMGMTMGTTTGTAMDQTTGTAMCTGPAAATITGMTAAIGIELGAGADGATLLRLLWLASPVLPVGGYSYSEVLESAVEHGVVHDEASAALWLSDQLALGLARAELPLLGAACRAWRDADDDAARALNDWFIQTRETGEALLQAQQMGRSMTDWLRGRWPQCERVRTLATFAPAPAWPLAWALGAMRSGAQPRDALLAYAFGWAENMVQAALKAAPLGQTAGQRLLAALVDAIPGLVQRAEVLPPAQWQSFLPMWSVLGARHETQYSRLFRS